MKALVIRGKEQMSLENQEDPVLKTGQVMIAPKYIGICGSDIHYYFNGANGTAVIKEPFVAGHEFSGLLINKETINGKVYPAGTEVTIHPATWGNPVRGAEDKREIWPGGSYYGSASSIPHCNGGMREKMAVNKNQIRVLPKAVSLEEGSLAEPLAVALHGITLATDIKDKDVLVSGAGPIGLLTAISCVLKGAKTVTVSDVLSGPLERAKLLGATAEINLGNGQTVPSDSYDIVFECSGSAPGITTAFDAVRLGGTIIQIGMVANKVVPINIAAVSFKEATYKGSLRFDKEFDEAIDLLAANKIISKVITHTYPATSAIEAFNMAKNSQESGKVIISFV